MQFTPKQIYICHSPATSFACLCLPLLLPCPIHSERPIRSFCEPVITETNYQYKLQRRIVINRTKLECKTETVFYNYYTRVEDTTVPNCILRVNLPGAGFHQSFSVSHSPVHQNHLLGTEKPITTALAHSVSPMRIFNSLNELRFIGHPKKDFE